MPSAILKLEEAYYLIILCNLQIVGDAIFMKEEIPFQMNIVVLQRYPGLHIIFYKVNNTYAFLNVLQWMMIYNIYCTLPYSNTTSNNWNVIFFKLVQPYSWMESILLYSPPREQFPVLMHGGQPIWKGRCAAALWKIGKVVAAESDRKGTLKPRDGAVQNKAE